MKPNGNISKHALRKMAAMSDESKGGVASLVIYVYGLADADAYLLPGPAEEGGGATSNY